MTGASEAHIIVAGNLFAMLRDHVRGGPYRVYISDMTVRIEPADTLLLPGPVHHL